MSFDRADEVFANMLERSIRKVLQGDENEPGLYRTVRSSPNWDNFQRACGMIEGYEAVLHEMRNIVLRVNNENAARNNVDRSMN